MRKGCKTPRTKSRYQTKTPGQSFCFFGAKDEDMPSIQSTDEEGKKECSLQCVLGDRGAEERVWSPVCTRGWGSRGKSAVSSVHTGMEEQRKGKHTSSTEGLRWRAAQVPGSAWEGVAPGRPLHKMEGWSHLGWYSISLNHNYLHYYSLNFVWFHIQFTIYHISYTWCSLPQGGDKRELSYLSG